MFDKVVDWLEDTSQGSDQGYADRDVRAAVAAIYYHMITLDGIVSLGEMQRFTSILKRQFRLSEEKVHELVKRGVDWEKNSPGLFPFTVILNHEMSDKKRRLVLKRLAERADSDGHRSSIEVELLDHIRQLLKLDESVMETC